MSSDDNDSFADSFDAEYDALLNRSGYIALKDWSVVTLAGTDRQSFLHNMCTNEINKLTVGEGCEAFCTDVKGKILAHLWVLLLENRTTLLSVPNQAEQIVSHLDRYIIREDVQLADQSRVEAWTLLAGAQADGILNDAGVELAKPWQSATYRLGGAEGLLVRFALPGRNAYLLSTSCEQVASLHRLLNEAGAIACGEQAWTTLRVETGWPLFGTDFNHSHLPQEVARDAQAISFTKGCYLGQETVARIDALGHVNNRLVTLRFAEGATPKPGTPITQQQQQVGMATTIGRLPRSKAHLALGMVRRGSNEVGAVLDSEFGPVEVIPTPAIGD